MKIKYFIPAIILFACQQKTAKLDEVEKMKLELAKEAIPIAEQSCPIAMACVAPA